MKHTINLRQMACLAGVLVFANKILVLPSLFYDKVGVDGIFVLLFMFSIDLLFLWLFFRLKRAFPKESFFEIISKFLSKYVAIFIFSLICIFFLIKTITTYNIALLYLKNQVYFEAEEYIFPICFLTVTNNLVCKGIRSEGRTCEFFYAFTLTLVGVWIFCSCLNFNGFPMFFNIPAINIGRTAFSFLSVFGDNLFFFLIMDKIEYKKENAKTVYWYVIINMVLVAIFYTVFYSVFRYTGSMHNNAASDVITFSNKFAGLGRIDIVAVVVVMLLDYFQLSIYNTAFDSSFSSIFPNERKVFSIVLYDLLFFIGIFFFIPNHVITIDFAEKYLCYFALVLEYLLPLSCIIFSVFKPQRRKYEKIF